MVDLLGMVVVVVIVVEKLVEIVVGIVETITTTAEMAGIEEQEVITTEVLPEIDLTTIVLPLTTTLLQEVPVAHDRLPTMAGIQTVVIVALLPLLLLEVPLAVTTTIEVLPLGMEIEADTGIYWCDIVRVCIFGWDY